MAFIDPNDPNQQQNQQGGMPQAVGQTGVATGTTPLTGGSQSAFSTGGGGTNTAPGAAPRGQGGGDGWTNIQNYLTANQGNSNSAGLLNQNASSTIGNDRSQFDNQAKQARDAGQTQVAGVSQDQASQLLGQATSQYGQGTGYQGIVSQLQGMINNPYSGPKSGDFSYGMNPDSQNLGSAMGGSQGAFDSYMQGLYGKVAGPMTAGSQALQSQLDAGNTALQDARQSAASQYGDLGKYIGDQSQAVNSELGQDQSQYVTNQKGVKDYFNTTAGKDQSAINQRIADDNAYLSGIASQLRPMMGGPQLYMPEQVAYDASSGPNQNNVAGVEAQRNNFNTIQDVLGSGSKIQSAAPWDFKQAAYNNAPTVASMGVQPLTETLGQMNAGTDFSDPNLFQNIQNYLNR